MVNETSAEFTKLRCKPRSSICFAKMHALNSLEGSGNRDNPVELGYKFYSSYEIIEKRKKEQKLKEHFTYNNANVK